MKNFKTLHNERGFILLVVYVVVIFVTLFSVAFFARHRAAIQATERYQNKILAFNAAESGIDFALRELATDSSLRTQTLTTPYTSAYVPMSRNVFRFSVSPVADQPQLRRIDSQGCSPSCTESSRGYQTSNITVYCQITSPAPPPPLFNHGIYGATSMSLSGNQTSAFDSYNSSQGAYGGSNISTSGIIALNSIKPGTLALSQTTIKGNVLVGYNGNPNIVISLNKATITGTRSNLPQSWTVPTQAVVPPGAIELGDELSNVTGQTTKTLATGTYHASSMKTAGQGKIVGTGAVKIYVDNGIDITGNGIVTADNHPSNFLIYSTSDANMKIAGNGSFYGGVYAPDSAVWGTGNGDFFGAVIAKTFSLTGNSAFHFDLAMAESQPVDPNQTQIVRVTAWQELNSLAWDTGQPIA